MSADDVMPDLFDYLSDLPTPSARCVSCGRTSCRCGRSVDHRDATRSTAGGGSDLVQSVGTATYDEWAIVHGFDPITRTYRRTD